MARIIHEVQPSLCNSAQNSHVAPNESNSDTQTSKNDQPDPSPTTSEAPGTGEKPLSPRGDSMGQFDSVLSTSGFSKLSRWGEGVGWVGWPEACILLGGWVGSNMGCRNKVPPWQMNKILR